MLTRHARSPLTVVFPSMGTFVWGNQQIRVARGLLRLAWAWLGYDHWLLPQIHRSTMNIHCLPSP